jgi:hypothetical protein
MPGFPYADHPPEDDQPPVHQCWLHRHRGDEPCAECAWMQQQADAKAQMWRQGAARD